MHPGSGIVDVVAFSTHNDEHEHSIEQVFRGARRPTGQSIQNDGLCAPKNAIVLPRFDGLRPAGSDLVQPAGILGNELHPHFGPSGQSQSGLAASMNRKVIFDQQPAVRLEVANYRLHELDVTGTISTRTDQDRSLSRGWFKRTMHPDVPPATVIGFKGRASRSTNPVFAGVGLDGQRTHLIDTNDPCVRRRPQIGPDDAPLFSANYGLCCSASWNQLCCRFHFSPSFSNQVQIVESERWRPYRSSNARYSRSSVHRA